MIVSNPFAILRIVGTEKQPPTIPQTLPENTKSFLAKYGCILVRNYVL